MVVYDEHVFKIKLCTGLSVIFCFFGSCTMTVGYLIGLGGLIPLMRSLRTVFDDARVEDYSFFPLFAAALAISFCAVALHSISYFVLIA